MAHRATPIFAVFALLHLPAVTADSVEPLPKRKVTQVEYIVSTDDNEGEITGETPRALADNPEPSEPTGWSELWE